MTETTRYALILAVACYPFHVAGDPFADNSPAVPVPECRNATDGTEVACNHPDAVRLWPSGLRPGRPGEVFPVERDSTQWFALMIPGADFGTELFQSLDVLGDKLYVAYNAGLLVWDVAEANAEDPERELVRDGWRGDFLSFPQAGENDFLVDDVAAVATAGGALVVLSGRSGVGLSVWEHSTSPADLVPVYQDQGNSSRQVRVVEQGGTPFAFAASADGISVYDLAAAQALAEPCLDAGGTVCPGVFRGQLGTAGPSLYLDIVRRGGQVYVARSGGAGSDVEIWEIADPASPGNAGLRFQGLADGGQGLAFFEFDETFYLAVVERAGAQDRLRIYDAGACLDADGCGSLGLPLFDQGLPGGTSFGEFLTFSTSNGRPFLYYGIHQPALAGSKAELLLDLGGFPLQVTEVTEDGGSYFDDCTGNTVDYWGDYYPGNGHGLNNVRPLVGRFRGDHFYRTGFGILDVHVRGDSTLLFADGFESGDTSAW